VYLRSISQIKTKRRVKSVSMLQPSSNSLVSMGTGNEQHISMGMGLGMAMVCAVGNVAKYMSQMNPKIRVSSE